MLEHFAVGGILQRNLGPTQRLQTANGGIGRGDARVGPQRQRLDPLFVGAQIRDGGIRLEHLPAPLNADISLEPHDLVASRECGGARRHVGGSGAMFVSRDMDDGLIEQCQRVAGLLVDHPGAGALHPAAREFDRSLPSNRFVALRVSRVLGFDRQAIRGRQPHVAVERHRRLFLSEASLFRGHAEGTRTLPLLGADGHADERARPVRKQPLLVAADEHVFPRHFEPFDLAAGALHDDARSDACRFERRPRRAALELKPDEDREYHAEHGNQQAGASLPEGHQSEDVRIGAGGDARVCGSEDLTSASVSST